MIMLIKNRGGVIYIVVFDTSFGMSIELFLRRNQFIVPNIVQQINLVKDINFCKLEVHSSWLTA